MIVSIYYLKDGITLRQRTDCRDHHLGQGTVALGLLQLAFSAATLIRVVVDSLMAK